MAVVEFSINPLGTKDTSVSQYIARAIKVIQKEKGIKYTLTPMGTVLEGNLPQLLDLIQRAQEVVFAAGVNRIVTFIKIDDRRDKPTTMEGKLVSLKREMK